MKLPSFRDLVDAELPLSEEELNRIWTEVQSKRRSPTRETAIFFAICFGPLFALLALYGFLASITAYRKTLTLVMVVLMIGWMFASAHTITKRPWYASAFRRELSRRGHRVCISCGYWLRGLNQKSKHCPECGKPLRRHRRRGDRRHPVKYKSRR